MADFDWLTGVTLHKNIGADEKNQPFFNTLDEQWSWFDQRKQEKFERVQYQRVERGYIKLPRNYERLIEVDYISFINRNYGTKRFYARVTEKRYVNENLTYIYYEVDAFQSFHFDFKTPKNYVLRQHAVKDWTGHPNLRHVFPESTSGYNMFTEKRTFYNIGERQGYRMFFTKNAMFKLNEALGIIKEASPKTIDGINSGVCVIDMEDNVKLTEVMTNMDKMGASDNILALWQLPKIMLTDNNVHNDPSLAKVTLFNFTTDIDGYEAQNNKSLFYPYRYIRVSNNSGGSKIYKYEDFKDPKDIKFSTKYTASMFPTYALFPLDYKGVAINYEEALYFNNFPMLAVQSNAFTSWFAQNVITVGIQAGSAIMSGGASAVGSIGSIADGASAILEGDKAVKTANGGYLNVALDTQGFTFEQVSVHKEVAEMVDTTFSKYGYKFNSLMDVNYNSRPCWNYVQLQDAHIEGSFAAEFKNSIEKMLNNGVTFWKQGIEMGNYDRDNKGV